MDETPRRYDVVKRFEGSGPVPEGIELGVVAESLEFKAAQAKALSELAGVYRSDRIGVGVRADCTGVVTDRDGFYLYTVRVVRAGTVCPHCLGDKPEDQSCGCFDNGCQ